MRIAFLGILFLAVLTALPSFAQDISNQKTDKQPNAEISGEGQIKIYQDSRVDTIVKRHIAYNQQQDGMDGYRVQIFFDAGNNSLNRATNVAEQFQLIYPNDTAYISFSEPNYKVRIGDFRTKLDAEGYLQEILPDYPNAFVIKDRINFPKLD